jgi:hypothetical protein
MIKWRKVRLAEHVMHMGEMRSARIILVGRLEGKRHFWSYRYRWKGKAVL